MAHTQERRAVADLALTEAAAHDGALLAPLLARDPTAAGSLWRRFAPTVFRMLRRTLGPRAQIDDAVQDVLLRVYRKARGVKTGSDLTLLVLKTTSRVAYVWLRRHDTGLADGGDGERDAVVRFYRVIARLSAWDRIAFTLHFIEGLGPRKISAVIGSSSGRTRRRLHRGLREVYAGIRCDPVLRQVGESARA